MVRVRMKNVADTGALIYIANDERLGTPRPGYLERVVAAAGHSCLPEHYIAELNSVSN